MDYFLIRGYFARQVVAKSLFVGIIKKSVEFRTPQIRHHNQNPLVDFGERNGQIYRNKRFAFSRNLRRNDQQFALFLGGVSGGHCAQICPNTVDRLREKRAIFQKINDVGFVIMHTFGVAVDDAQQTYLLVLTYFGNVGEFIVQEPHQKH